jgi:acyl-CoA reductase-like NAD-dependent aldehyde dehydrogenase
VGNAIVDHDDVALITFTGSPEVGWGIRARAARKRVGLELGNNAPVILEADGDWRTAVAKIKTAGFSHAGQSCISTQRVLAHSSIAAEVEKELVAAVETLVIGDPMDEATDVSSLINVGERDRVASWIAQARDAGARVVSGGDIDAAGVLHLSFLPVSLIGEAMLWVAAALTLMTGRDYLIAGLRHAETEPGGRAPQPSAGPAVRP